jgi:hypothetical protein
VTMKLEDQLRDAYQAAARTVRPETIRPGVQYHRAASVRGASSSRLHGRFSMFAPLAAAASVAVAVIAAIAVPNLLGGSGNRPPANATTPATIGTAPFMVEMATTNDERLAVLRAGTQHITDLIPAPPGTSSWNAVAATSGTTFVAAASSVFVNFSLSGSVYSSSIYRFTLSAKGKPGRLTRLSSGIHGDITALAASPDGHRIAYTTAPQGDAKQATISVVTGTATRHWTVLTAGPGSTGLMPGSLTLTADGGELGFITVTVADTVGWVRTAGTTWLLPASSATGSATARGREVTTGPPDSVPLSAVLSADGQTMYVLSMSTSVPYSARSVPESITLSAYSTSDGALIRTIHTWTGIPYTDIGYLGMTIGGSQLLVWGVDGATGYQVDPVSGAIKPVRLYFPPNKFHYVGGWSIAW